MKQQLTLITHNINGNEIKCTFEESKSNSGYGRDIYIRCVVYVDGRFANEDYWDCRYILDYDFKEMCYSFVKRNWKGAIVEA